MLVCGQQLLLCLTVYLYNLDLKTMSKRVESEQYYVTLEMFVADVKRMFANARTYNSPDTIYYKCATRHDHFLVLMCCYFYLFLLSSEDYRCSIRRYHFIVHQFSLFVCNL